MLLSKGFFCTKANYHNRHFPSWLMTESFGPDITRSNLELNFPRFSSKLAVLDLAPC